MKLNITGEMSIEELTTLLDKIREHRIADQKEWEENHPPFRPTPFTEPSFMTEEPEKKKEKPN